MCRKMHMGECIPLPTRVTTVPCDERQSGAAKYAKIVHLKIVKL